MTLATNHNNKLHCQAFVHITAPPFGQVKEADLGKTYSITTADGSHPGGHWKLEDFVRIRLRDVRSYLTYPSHGMNYIDFITWYKQQNRSTGYDDFVALYFYTS